MSKRSDKMYKDSPTIKSDDDGKKVVAKGKTAEENDSGTDHMHVNEKHAMEMEAKHSKERLDLHHKHEKEHHAMHLKHMGEKMKPSAEKHEGGHESKGKEGHSEKKTDQHEGAK